ncbi:MAG: Asp-tRNA(Asn)/Glu-tRNA(Gln) amidotransferase subunit GatB, partial [Candidatus Pacebacteria bacterium]|nr:Asp-tRNA(Asn)/Glu-tRNA(Gln) amidotransferase subunit GatB [Candidatus Paceibacterota bacterium]
ERHIRMLEKGEKIVQETRGWDEGKETTYSQRKKEDSHDYRYFPDPDIPKLWISEVPEFSAENLKKEMPELPWIKREKYKKYKLKPEEIEVSLQHPTLGDYIEELSREFEEDIDHVRLAANYLYSDVLGILKSATKPGETFDFSKSEKMITPKQLAEITRMLKANEISSRGAKDILAVIMSEGGDPKKIANEKGLIQKSDPEALKKIIEKIIADNPKAVSEYKAGKLNNLQFLIGCAMKETKGSANPAVLKGLFELALK